MKPGFVEKLIERLGRIGPEEVQNYLLRLAQEKGFLETIFNSIQEGVIVTDAKGRINYLNHAACEIFGLDAEEAIGKPLGEQARGLDWKALSQSGSALSRDMEIFYPANRFINFYVVPLIIERRTAGERPDDSIEVQDVTSDTTLTFGADGTFSETGSATTELAMSFSQACITAAAGQQADELLIGLFCDQITQALTEEAGMDPTEATCEVVDTTCNCTARQQTPVDSSGQFTIEGTQVVYVSDGGLRQDFCVQGDQLKVGTVEGSGLDAHVVYTRVAP